MASGRARCTRKLRNWVVEQVESGQFPGVCWEDKEKTMFRIPWKHAGKQDFREDQDAAFFKAWAMYKGKYKNGDMEGPATWKTRLRCALNKSPEFEEVPERGQMDGPEPYKVYRLLPQGTLPAQPETRKPPSKRHHSFVSSEKEDESTVKKYILSPSLPQDPLQREEVDADGGVGYSDFGNSSSNSSSNNNNSSSSSSSSSSSNCNSPEPQKGADTIQAFLQRDQACLELLLLPKPECQAEQEDNLQETVPWDPSLPIDYSLLLTFFYNGRKAGEAQVQSLDFRLVAELLDYQCGIEQVLFPKPGPKEAAQRLLNQVERGVLVASNKDGLFVERLCPIPISWNAPQSPSGPGPHLLPSKECFRLFTPACFLRDFERFSQGRGPPPKFQVTLNFWEESPGPSHTHDNCLVTVQMEQAFARQWLKETQEGQAATLSLVQSFEDLPSPSAVFSLAPLSETVDTPCSPARLGDSSQCFL